MSTKGRAEQHRQLNIVVFKNTVLATATAALDQCFAVLQPKAEFPYL